MSNDFITTIFNGAVQTVRAECGHDEIRRDDLITELTERLDGLLPDEMRQVAEAIVNRVLNV